MALIEEAFEQWVASANGLISVNPEKDSSTGTYEDCSDLSELELALLVGEVITSIDSGFDWRPWKWNWKPWDWDWLDIIVPGDFDVILDVPLLENPDVREDDQLSEVRLFDDIGFEKVLNFPQMLVDPFKKCIYAAPACTTFISGFSESDRGLTCRRRCRHHIQEE